jgi:hypothetical protein
MDNNLHKNMIALSNNSTLTGQAAVKLSDAIESLPMDDRRTVLQWFEHAKREQETKVDNAKRKLNFR